MSDNRTWACLIHWQLVNNSLATLSTGGPLITGTRPNQLNGYCDGTVQDDTPQILSYATPSFGETGEWEYLGAVELAELDLARRPRRARAESGVPLPVRRRQRISHLHQFHQFDHGAEALPGGHGARLLFRRHDGPDQRLGLTANSAAAGGRPSSRQPPPSGQCG